MQKWFLLEKVMRHLNKTIVFTAMLLASCSKQSEQQKCHLIGRFANVVVIVNNSNTDFAQTHAKQVAENMNREMGGSLFHTVSCQPYFGELDN